MSKLAGIWSILTVATACASTSVTPGTPRTVAKAAADAYSAAGHKCQLKADLAYCDTQGGNLPLLIGYNGKTQELLFATVYDTEAGFGRACPSLPADQVLRPEWMVVKCDQIEYDDKTRKVVLSVVGGGRIPDQGMSRAELNRSAGMFIQEAEGYLIRLKTAVAHVQQVAPADASPVSDSTPNVTKL
jgi:hypothetical protein